MEAGGGGIGFALKNATLEGKITIGTLLIFSLVSWTVIINKFWQLRKAKKQTEKFLTAYSEGKGPLEVYDQNRQFDGSPLYDVYATTCEELKRQMKKYGGKVPFHGMSAVRIAMERGMGEANISLESGLIVLSSAISGGPFIGLLGTVWGVMDTFSNIARLQQASLTAMAPGVSAALIATVVGLMVAIPSLFCYNYLITKIREVTVEIDNFGAHIDNVLSTEYLRGDEPGDPPLQLPRPPMKEESKPREYPLPGTPHPDAVQS